VGGRGGTHGVGPPGARICVTKEALEQYRRGTVLQTKGDVRGAIAAYERAVRLNRKFAEAWSNLGNAYRQAGRREEALDAYDAAIRAKPEFAAAHCNRGVLLIELERYAEAAGALESAARLAPDMPEAHANLAHTYRRLHRYEEAIAAGRAAIELRPQYRDAHLNLAAAAYEIDALDEARSANQRASEIDPGSAQAWCNLAGVYHAMGRFSDAVAANERAIALRPDYAEAHANLALTLLLMGDFKGGWTEYPWIRRTPLNRGAYPYLDRFPLWDGKPFAGRHLVVTREQGFGDAIQMARYFPLVKALGGTLAVEVAPPLAVLLESASSIDELRIVKDPIVPRGDVDLQIPLLGLPGALGTEVASIPATIPYLSADPVKIARWEPVLAADATLRVGIAWAGSPQQVDDRHRSCSLTEFEPLAAVESVAWFGLQKGRDEELCGSGAFALRPLGAQIEDFADTAAIMSILDLIVTVDSSPAHLAGALGRPVWTLVPCVPHWSYLLEREDSLWYPTMRLFRQPRPGDWESVFRRVARELRALLLARQ
jgi:tetratricopeptide (TPR) repeat protein